VLATSVVGVGTRPQTEAEARPNGDGDCVEVVEPDARVRESGFHGAIDRRRVRLHGQRRHDAAPRGMDVSLNAQVMMQTDAKHAGMDAALNPRCWVAIAVQWR